MTYVTGDSLASPGMPAQVDTVAPRTRTPLALPGQRRVSFTLGAVRCPCARRVDDGAAHAALAVNVIRCHRCGALWLHVAHLAATLEGADDSLGILVEVTYADLRDVHRRRLATAGDILAALGVLPTPHAPAAGVVAPVAP